VTIPDRFPAVLAAAAMGVYLLIVVGATTSLTEAAAACGGWPACLWERRRAPDGDRGLDRPRPPAARGRRGGPRCPLRRPCMARRREPSNPGCAHRRAARVPRASRRGRARRGGQPPGRARLSSPSPRVAIFAAVLAGLAWWLEAETGDPDDVPVDFQPGTDDLPPVEDAPEPDVPTATVPGCGRLRRRTSG